MKSLDRLCYKRQHLNATCFVSREFYYISTSRTSANNSGLKHLKYSQNLSNADNPLKMPLRVLSTSKLGKANSGWISAAASNFNIEQSLEMLSTKEDGTQRSNFSLSLTSRVPGQGFNKS